MAPLREPDEVADERGVRARAALARGGAREPEERLRLRLAEPVGRGRVADRLGEPARRRREPLAHATASPRAARSGSGRIGAWTPTRRIAKKTKKCPTTSVTAATARVALSCAATETAARTNVPPSPTAIAPRKTRPIRSRVRRVAASSEAAPRSCAERT